MLVGIGLPALSQTLPIGVQSLAGTDETQVQPPALNVAVPFFTRGENSLQLTGGFSNNDGSFVALSDSFHNLLKLGETLHLTAEAGVRSRRIEFGFTSQPLSRTKIQYGFTVYGQRFHYNQEQESSITAFQRTISLFNSLDPNDLIDYRSTGHGVKLFAGLPLNRGRGWLNLSWS